MPLVEAPEPTVQAGPRFAVVKFADCGLCFTDPRPSPESIGQFYPHTYRPHQTCGLRHARTREPRRYGRLGWHGEGRLLDVGCGGGEFLHRMSLAGWHVTGLDLSREVVERIRRELGLRALAGSLPHAELAPGSFDVITMWQSLEHFHQPLEMLEQAHKSLVPGGNWWPPCRISTAVRSARSDRVGSAWTCRGTWSTSRRLRCGRCWSGPASRWKACGRSAGRPGSAPRPGCASRNQGPARLHWLTLGPVGRLAAFYFHLRGRSDTILATAIKPR